MKNMHGDLEYLLYASHTIVHARQKLILCVETVSLGRK